MHHASCLKIIWDLIQFQQRLKKFWKIKEIAGLPNITVSIWQFSNILEYSAKRREGWIPVQ